MKKIEERSSSDRLIDCLPTFAGSFSRALPAKLLVLFFAIGRKRLQHAEKEMKDDDPWLVFSRVYPPASLDGAQVGKILAEAIKSGVRPANLDYVKSVVEAKRRNASANGSTISAKQLELLSSSSCRSFETTAPGRKQLLEAWGPYFKGQMSHGRKIYLLTFQFGELQKEEFSSLEIMERETNRFYGTLATRAVRKPRSKSGRERLPIMLVAPDLPVRKNNRYQTVWDADVYLNGGLHYHAVIAVHPDSRIRLMEHLRESINDYVIPKHALIGVHAKRIKTDIDFVVDYVVKNVKHGKFPFTRVITYPKPPSELLTQLVPNKDKKEGDR